MILFFVILDFYFFFLDRVKFLIYLRLNYKPSKKINFIIIIFRE
jgi:hypothetical protein